jgi:aryl-alcohol dehydrogenase-like predicted oxidoreductase
VFEKLAKEGKIIKLGVSVEKVEEALKAIEYQNVDTVQIIFNLFRQRPVELFFEQARKRNIGIIARVPLASGMLSGKFKSNTKFSPADHRHFNREGAVFDKGETFSGVEYQAGLEAVEKLKMNLPQRGPAMLALRWILMFPEVSCVIPGASRPEQVVANIGAGMTDPLSLHEMEIIRQVYDNHVREYVHYRW